VQSDPQVLELLNEVLTAELTAVNQYFLDAKMFDNWGYDRLAERFRSESIDEMKDADHLIDRLLYFDGHPNLQRLDTIRTGRTRPRS
jgi:bacterioferritin